MMESPFTRIPNIFLERFKKDPYGLIFAFVIYRWTIGFQRKSFKLTNAKISEESGISQSKIGEIRKRACKKAEIIYSKIKGGYEYEITIFPSGKGSITPRERMVSSGVKVDYPQGNVLRGAIDNTIDNSKENRVLFDFLKKYPKVKATNQKLILQAYDELSNDERNFLAEAIYYQTKYWDAKNVSVEYIPKAEIYLKERKFSRGEVGDSVRKNRAVEKRKIERHEFEKSANENSEDIPENLVEIFEQSKNKSKFQ